MRQQRDQERQIELEFAASMREKARFLLALPVEIEMIKRNRKGVEIERLFVPEYKAFTAAVRLLSEAKDHARSALEMVDKRIVDPSKLSTDALLKLLAILDSPGEETGIQYH